jgi:hypothetical protein
MGLMASLLVVLLLASGGAAAAQSQAQEMFICHRTGSPTNPWVFMSIDASTWPEHEAQGDVRANSLTDCATAAAQAPAPAAQEAAPSAPAAQPAPAATSAPAAQPAPAATTAPQARPTPASPVASPAESPPQVANVQVASPEQARPQAAANPQAQAESAPPVSSLPASGEPDHPALVLGLLMLLATGLGLRRLGGRHA